MIRSIENQVLSHDSETDKAEITTRTIVRRADIDAGEARTKVSKAQQGYVWRQRRAQERLDGFSKLPAGCHEDLEMDLHCTRHVGGVLMDEV